jgi:mono/diheme cytochrome c family protein
MHFNSRKIVLCCFIAIAFLSCRSALYIPVQPASNGSATVEELVTGRKLYIENCGSCHALHNPNEYTHDQWINEVSDMQERAQINDSSRELILKYLWNAPVTLH